MSEEIDDTIVDMFPSADFSTGDVSEIDDIEVVESPEVPEEKKPDIDFSSNTYSSRPALMDQYAKMPETVRFGPSKVAVYALLNNPKDVDAYNCLLSREYPETSPSVIIEESRINNDFAVLVKYRELQYLQLN